VTIKKGTLKKVTIASAGGASYKKLPPTNIFLGGESGESSQVPPCSDFQPVSNFMDWESECTIGCGRVLFEKIDTS
jgi:hypothetical protein